MKEDRKINLPCVFYFYLHSKLKEKTEDGTMPVKEVEWRMFQWKIPSCLRPLIIKEMEMLNLLKKEERRMVRFLESDFNIEQLGELYKELGIINE